MVKKYTIELTTHEGNTRYVRVTAHRRKPDFAHCMQWLVEPLYPDAVTVVVALDNRNTHFPNALSETFARQKAERILAPGRGPGGGGRSGMRGFINGRT